MKFIKFFLIFVVCIAVLSLFVIMLKFYWTKSPAINSASGQMPLATQTRIWEAKIDNTGPVSIEVIPQDISDTKDQWKFSLAINTHTWELQEDVQKSAKLIDDAGKAYQALLWDGAPPGGHHRTGNLLFQRISPMPKAIELQIENIGGVQMRSFLWQLQ